jgi:signal transduction histidine kinase
LLYRIHENQQKVTLIDVSHIIDQQQEMLWVWILALLVCGGITFLLSKIFVHRSLSELWKLSDYIKQKNIYTLDTPLELTGPPDDEIRSIANRLQDSFKTIKKQTDSLKDFIALASHELKTPLMMMSTHLDLTEKTQDF